MNLLSPNVTNVYSIFESIFPKVLGLDEPIFGKLIYYGYLYFIS